MRNSLVASLSVVIAIIFFSCEKANSEKASSREMSAGLDMHMGRGVTPYKFERINVHNFYSQGWKEQQVNIAAGVTSFSDLADAVAIVCGPDNTSDPRLNKGCVTMNLPTSGDPTLRRIRLRRGGYSGTLLTDISELKYSTYVVQNSPTIMVLQIDVNTDDTKDFNIYFEPRNYTQPNGFPPLILNTWQQWDPLHQGVWHIEVPVVLLPPDLADLVCTIPEVIAAFPNARIIDTPPLGHNGEGVRFTIGGNPRNLFDNTIGYFDALIIGTRKEQHSTLFDFMCNSSDR